MLAAGPVLAVSVAYLGLLFAVATWADRRAQAGRSLLASPYAYTLSLAAYCSAWTFYGSVGLASREGLAFLPVYLGPTLAALLFPLVLRKMLRVARAQGVTSIADFLAARYGKSGLLGGLATLVAVAAAVPYLALQLKAVAASAAALAPEAGGAVDMALVAAAVLAAFAVVFGARHSDATERHEGVVVAVALESLVKLAAFLLVGAWATWGLFDGPGDLLARHAAAGGGPALTVGGGEGAGYADWLLLTLLSGLAFLVLPRQFHLAVIENVREDHVRTASWLLPLYLLAINLFVLPLAMAGALTAAGDADLHVLRVPLAAGQGWLALAAYVGGLSAAAAMVIVACVALSAMVSNDLLVPLLLRLGYRRRGGDLSRPIVAIRRGAVLALMALAYAFSRLVGWQHGLANIGFVAFAGVAQLAPAVLAGLYWRGACRAGAFAGILGGVAVWGYALVLPLVAEAGLIDAGFVERGAFGVGLLRPRALFGLEGLDPAAHAVLWSLGVNVTLLVLGSLLGRPGAVELLQAARFVDADRERPWRGGDAVAAAELRGLLARFMGEERAHVVFAMDAWRRGRALPASAPADAALVELVERQLARGIGAASARVMVGSVARGEGVGREDLMEVLDEASRLAEYGRRLEQKSDALGRASAELREAYDRLRQLDELKDEFVATVSHELRTPLTSIRSFSEILLDAPDLAEDERRRFLEIVVREADRLARLVDDVLDLAKIEAGRTEWREAEHELGPLLEEAAAAVGGAAAERRVAMRTELKAGRALVRVDRDRLVQVAVNLLSNAAKFAPEGEGRVLVRLLRHDGTFLVRVEDNGPGVPEAQREAVFERFRQVGDGARGKPKGTGLGLTISRQIVERFGGRIWVEESSALGGAAACFTLPEAAKQGRAAA